MYGNGIDLTDMFQNESSPFSFDESNIQLTRVNGSLNVFFMGTGRSCFETKLKVKRKE